MTINNIPRTKNGNSIRSIKLNAGDTLELTFTFDNSIKGSDPGSMAFSVTRVFKSTAEIPFDNEKVAEAVDLLDFKFKQFSGKMATVIANL